MAITLSKEYLEDCIEKKYTRPQIAKESELTLSQVKYALRKYKLFMPVSNLSTNAKKCNVDFFKSNTKKAYYWAGFIAADGWIEEDRNRLGIGLAIKDIEHIMKFKKAIKAEHTITNFMNDKAARIRISNKTIINDLKNIFNITGRKTFIYTMPIFEDEYLFYEFMRGYIDGDGCLFDTGTGIRLNLVSASYEFMYEYRELLTIVLCKNNLPKIGEQTYKNVLYSLTLGQKDSLTLLTKIYKNSSINTRLDRKYKIFKKYRDKGIVHDRKLLQV